MNRDVRMESEDVRRGAYNGEHAMAWVMAAAAIVLGVIGYLVGFGIIGDDFTALSDTNDGVAPNWQQGMLWMLAAVSCGLLAMALHQSDHHRRAQGQTHDDREETMFNTEHALAYLMAIATLTSAVIGLLVGFDVIENGISPEDGFVWLVGANVFGALTYALHSVRHHQYAFEEELVTRIVDERVGAPGTAARREPGIERRS